MKMVRLIEIPRSICREDALAPDNTKALRLVLIVAIFIFHAGIHMGFLTPDLGHVCVSVFFFLTGYGLEYSLANKPDYARSFLHRRVLGLMIQYWIIMTVLAAFVFTIHRSWDQFLVEFTATFGVPLWYITELVAFYIVFYLSMFISDRRKALLLIAAGTLFVMFVLWYHFNSDLYYRSGQCFVLGVAWYTCRGSFSKMNRGLISALLFLLITPLLLLNDRYPSVPVDFIMTSLSGLLASVMAVAFLAVDLRKGWLLLIMAILVSLYLIFVTWPDTEMSVGPIMILIGAVSSELSQIPWVSSVAAFLGRMSLELYLLHMNMLHYMYPNVTESVLWSTVMAGIATLILGYVLFRVCGYVLSRYDAAYQSISDKKSVC